MVVAGVVMAGRTHWPSPSVAEFSSGRGWSAISWWLFWLKPPLTWFSGASLSRLSGREFVILRLIWAAFSLVSGSCVVGMAHTLRCDHGRTGVRHVGFLLDRQRQGILVDPEAEDGLLRLDPHRHEERQQQVADAKLQPALRMLLRPRHAADSDDPLRSGLPQRIEPGEGGLDVVAAVERSGQDQ